MYVIWWWKQARNCELYRKYWEQASKCDLNARVQRFMFWWRGPCPRTLSPDPASTPSYSFITCFLPNIHTHKSRYRRWYEEVEPVGRRGFRTFELLSRWFNLFCIDNQEANGLEKCVAHYMQNGVCRKTHVSLESNEGGKKLITMNLGKLNWL